MAEFQGLCPWQRAAGKAEKCFYHLHSTASTFWGGEDDEGLIPVSEEADDMDAPVWDTEHTQQHISRRLSKYSSQGRFPWLLGCVKVIKAAAQAHKIQII